MTPMTPSQVQPIGANSQPVFPCELLRTDNGNWQRFDIPPTSVVERGGYHDNLYSHWRPVSDTPAPSALPADSSKQNAVGESDKLILDKMRETLAKCADPLGGPLAMAPERIVAYVEHLREREFAASRLLYRARQAEMDRDDAFAYIHALWSNGQLPAPMNDSLKARVKKWGDPDASPQGITFEEAAKRVADNA